MTAYELSMIILFSGLGVLAGSLLGAVIVWLLFKLSDWLEERRRHSWRR